MSVWREDGKDVVIRLSPKAAKLVYLNADGWIDAGACDGGLEPAENRALNALCDQIRKQLIEKASRK